MMLLEVLERYVPLRKASGSRYVGPCPRCGGSPRSERFSIRTDKGGFFHCYGCSWNGDIIRALRDLEGMKCPEAYAAAGKECDSYSCPVSENCRKGKGQRQERHKLETPEVRGHASATFTPSPAQSPEELWQFKAEAMVVWAHQQLLAAPDQLVYLTSRGLGLDQVKRYWLGYVPKDLYRERAAWGLPEELRRDDKPKKLWIPRGIVIPSFSGIKLNRVRVRRPNDDLDRDRKRNPEKEPLRYYAIPGSGNDVTVLGETTRAAMVVESDLCALLIDSQAGDFIATISLTTASAKPKEAAARVLDAADVILVATDGDKAGALAFRWWSETYPGKAIRWPVRKGKDPSEAYAAGEDLRAWIMAGLPISLHPAKK